MTFAAALRNYFQTGDNGKTTTLTELKPFILDKDKRDAYVAELRSYGYEIEST